MICEECKKAGLKSQVRVGWATHTLMGGDSYWDEAGVWHDHDPNTTTTEYSCSNGHSWEVKTRKECPGCKVLKEVSKTKLDLSEYAKWQEERESK